MEYTVTGVCVFLVAALAGQVISATPKEVPLMSEYRDCAMVINRQLPWNNCTDTIDASLECTRQLSNSVDACPDGEKVTDDHSCNLMVIDLLIKPMAPSTTSICKIMSELTLCRQNECPSSTIKPMEENRNLTCSVSARLDCSVGATIVDGNQGKPQSYAQKYCSDFKVRKSCYIQRLQQCAGTDSEQMAVNLLFVGLNNHLEKCTQAEELCNNVTIPTNIPSLSSALTKDICIKVNQTYEDLNDCITGHEQITVAGVRVQANKKLAEMEDARDMCIKEGYTKDGPGGSASTIQPTMTALFVATLILTVLVH